MLGQRGNRGNVMWFLIRPEVWFFLLLLSAIPIGMASRRVQQPFWGNCAFYSVVALIAALSVWIGFHILQASYHVAGMSLVRYIVAPIEFSAIYVFGHLFVCLLIYIIACSPLGIFYYVYFWEKKTHG